MYIYMYILYVYIHVCIYIPIVLATGAYTSCVKREIHFNMRKRIHTLPGRRLDTFMNDIQ